MTLRERQQPSVEALESADTPLTEQAYDQVVDAAVEAASAEDLKAQRRLKRLHGRQDLADLFHATQTLLIRHKVGRISRVEVDANDTHHLFMCNLWRISRDAALRVTAWEMDLLTNEWVSISPAQLPAVMVWPILCQDSRRDDLDRLLEKALWLCLNASGYAELATRRREKHNKTLVAALFYDQLGIKRRESPGKRPRSFIGPQARVSGMRALRAGFHHHIVEPEILRALLAIDHRRLMDTRIYTSWAIARDQWLPVARTQRNLLPLLMQIHPSYWPHADLFSRAWWVRGASGTKDGKTRVDRTRFSLSCLQAKTPNETLWITRIALDQVSQAMSESGKGFREMVRLSSLPSVATWRLLKQMPLSLVQNWLVLTAACPLSLQALALTQIDLSPGRRRQFVTQAALANSQQTGRFRPPLMAVKRVIFALRRLINLTYRVNLSHPINGELWVRVWRAYLVEAAKVWHEFGHPAVKAWIARPYNDLSNVMDYLLAGGLQVHPENPRLSQPDKHQTWTTLRQKSSDWHQEQAQQTITAKASACWDGVIDESRHGSWVFIPLTNAYALAIESQRQFHCVGGFNYVEKGLAGDALFFSVRHVDFVSAEREGLAPPTFASDPEYADPYGELRYTLEVSLSDGRFDLEQLRGYDNANPPADVLESAWAWEKMANASYTFPAKTPRRTRRR